MKLDKLLNELFPQGHSIQRKGDILTGSALSGQKEIAVMGTTDQAAVGVETALSLAGFVLDVIRHHPGRPILMLVDTQGQRMSKRDELLGINSYLAHLAKCLELARQRGHRLVSLIYGEAVSGGFLSFGMMADEIHTLPDSRVGVMNLPAMARITKIDLERLQELSLTSPIFAPGIENFVKLGGVQSVWQSPLADALSAALARSTGPDCRREEGARRQGRNLAHLVSQRVVNESGGPDASEESCC